MKKTVWFLLLAGCLLLSACTAPQSIPTSTPIQTPHAISAATPTNTPSQSTATQEDDPFSWVSEEYNAEQIAAAEACRVQTEDAEYYFDTSVYMFFWDNLEFPLYRKDNETGWAEYMGTTGFAFQLCGQYIYIQSDVLQEDYPVGEMTRVVDIESGTITPFGRNIDIFVPSDGGFVYYTFDFGSAVYKANASLEHVKETKIEIPEQDEIKAEYGDIEELCRDITITDVKNGWIYFYYDVFYYEGEGIYSGNYRIRTDGTDLEKTDEGEFE